MDRLARKRETRKELVNAKRKARLISGYVKFKYPEVYADALNLYEFLNGAYPNKRDLTKTVEYLQITTGAVSYTKFYNDRKAQKKHQEKQTEMELRIPLLTRETVQSQTTLDIPGATDVVTEIMEDEPLRVVFNQITTETTTETTTTETTIHEGETNTASPGIVQLDDTTYKSLVEDLVNDPMLGDAFEDIDLNDPSPLEIELSNFGM